MIDVNKLHCVVLREHEPGPETPYAAWIKWGETPDECVVGMSPTSGTLAEKVESAMTAALKRFYAEIKNQ